MKQAVLKKLESIVGTEALLTRPEHLLVYECDGSTAFKKMPEAVVLPASTDEVVEVVRVCAAEGVPFLARGAGTGLSGGAIPAEGGLIIALNRMHRILSVDLDERTARVEAGVINLEITRAVADQGFFFAPDPSSQPSCTVGGNIAENSSGAHCLKYGPTASHILESTVVTPDGEKVILGGIRDHVGYDLLGFFIGSEGTFGIATEAVVRLMPAPDAVRTFLAPFASMVDACQAASDIVAKGIVPVALEMLDRPTIEIVEAGAQAAGYPKDAEAVLLVELDGMEAEIDRLGSEVESICLNRGAQEFTAARSDEDRTRLWKGRKAAFGAMGRISTDLYVQDGSVPRTRLPEVLAKVAEIGKKHNIQIANVFHVGDGNLHPCIPYDGRDEDERKRVFAAGREIMELCISVGGCISGEHGIGTEKAEFMHLMFSESDLRLMRSLCEVWNPKGLCNPGKIFATSHGCGEKAPPSSGRCLPGAWI